MVYWRIDKLSKTAVARDALVSCTPPTASPTASSRPILSRSTTHTACWEGLGATRNSPYIVSIIALFQSRAVEYVQYKATESNSNQITQASSILVAERLKSPIKFQKWSMNANLSREKRVADFESRPGSIAAKDLLHSTAQANEERISARVHRNRMTP